MRDCCCGLRSGSEGRTQVAFPSSSSTAAAAPPFCWSTSVKMRQCTCCPYKLTHPARPETHWVLCANETHTFCCVPLVQLYCLILMLSWVWDSLTGYYIFSCDYFLSLYVCFHATFCSNLSPLCFEEFNVILSLKINTLHHTWGTFTTNWYITLQLMYLIWIKSAGICILPKNMTIMRRKMYNCVFDLMYTKTHSWDLRLTCCTHSWYTAQQQIG